MSLILGLGLCSQLFRVYWDPFYQIILIRTPDLISDQVIQPRTYCSRKGFEEEWEEIPSFKSVYLWKAVNADRIQNGGSHFEVLMEQQVRVLGRGRVWGAGVAPKWSPPVPWQGEKSRIAGLGPVEAKPREVMAIMQGHPSSSAWSQPGPELWCSSQVRAWSPIPAPQNSSSLTLLFSWTSYPRFILSDLISNRNSKPRGSDGRICQSCTQISDSSIIFIHWSMKEK